MTKYSRTVLKTCLVPSSFKTRIRIILNGRILHRFVLLSAPRRDQNCARWRSRWIGRGWKLRRTIISRYVRCFCRLGCHHRGTPCWLCRGCAFCYCLRRSYCCSRWYSSSVLIGCNFENLYHSFPNSPPSQMKSLYRSFPYCHSSLKVHMFRRKRVQMGCFASLFCHYRCAYRQLQSKYTSVGSLL